MEHLFTLETHPFLNDHRLSGHPVLPLAVALDLIAWSADLTPPWGLVDIEVHRGVVLFEGEARVRVERDGNRLRVMQVRPSGRMVLAFSAAVADPLPPEPIATFEPHALPLTVTVAEFYDQHTFHGPLFQGILCATRRTGRTMEGRVAVSRPRDWQPSDARLCWHLDPLAVDSALQLGLYAALLATGKPLLPRSVGSVAVLAPFADRPVDVHIDLVEGSTDALTCTIHLSQDGRGVGWLGDLRAEFQATPSQ